MTHAAFLFIKPPTSGNEKVYPLVAGMLAAAGVSVVGEGELGAAEIDEKLLIDIHYGAIAKRAMLQEPPELNVPEAARAKFEAAFGLSWADALNQGLVLNAKAAGQRLGLDPYALEVEWRKAKGDDLIKFGGGFYCAKMQDGEGEGFYAINGFYPAMRAVFTTPPATVRWLSVEFPLSLSWAEFRGKVLGATDPSTASEGSVRRAIFDKWEELGLAKQPSTGENGVHASASPLEGLFERMNWLGASVESDVYGKALIEAGVPAEAIKNWSSDPAVTFEGQTLSVFDLHEDLDATQCTERSVQVFAQNPLAEPAPAEPAAGPSAESAAEGAPPLSPSGSGLNAARAISETA